MEVYSLHLSHTWNCWKHLWIKFPQGLRQASFQGEVEELKSIWFNTFVLNHLYVCELAGSFEAGAVKWLIVLLTEEFKCCYTAEHTQDNAYPPTLQTHFPLSSLTFSLRTKTSKFTLLSPCSFHFFCKCIDKPTSPATFIPFFYL